ncbi:MAG TPA: hypothetical protein VH115_08630 [Solirubrobacteraceae bacterium]|nr:hypothetical protein [Solirubrobacteraceae bacterium]
MSEVLVVASRTLAGAKLLEAVRERAAAGDLRVRLIVPASKPSAGLVIYDEAVRESAQVRVDLALSALAQEGISATGEVGDEDPFLATMDAIATRRPDEVIVSTHPVASSGWLRRDLIERIRSASGLPVEHIVVDIEREPSSYTSTLVLASRTLRGEQLLGRLQAKAAQEGQHLFIIVVPQEDGSGDAPRRARARLADVLDRVHAAGLLASGMIGDPDPYTAAVNALELFRVDDVLISTLPDERSGWMRAQLVERVRGVSSVPVEHIVIDVAAAPAVAGA